MKNKSILLIIFATVNISLCLANSSSSSSPKFFPFISEIVDAFGKLVIQSNGLPGSLNPSENINDILNDILPQLNTMSQDLTNLIQQLNECQQLKDKIDTDLKQPLDNIFNSLKSYFIRDNSNNNNLDLNTIQTRCKTNTDLNKIYKSIQLLMNQDAIDFVSSCDANNRYTKVIINKWNNLVKYVSLLFVFAFKGCEKVTNFKTGFDLDKFSNELSGSIEYYGSYGFTKSFVTDKRLGLRQILIDTINNNQHARLIVSRLGQDYDLFHWHVIRYQTQRDDNSYHYSQFTLTDENDNMSNASLCGSLHFYNNNNKLLKNGNKVLVAWCLVDLYPLNNKNIIFNDEFDSNSADLNVQETLDQNPKTDFNYNLVVNFSHKWIETEGTYLSELKCQLLETQTSRMCWCASKKQNENKTLSPVYLSNQSINFN